MEGEKRKHFRYPIIAIANMIADIGEIAAITAMVNDIGKLGMGLRSANPLKAGAPVSVDGIEISGTEIKDKINGTIAWISEEDHLYSMGMHFDEELTPAHQPALYKKVFQDVNRV